MNFERIIAVFVDPSFDDLYDYDGRYLLSSLDLSGCGTIEWDGHGDLKEVARPLSS